MTSVEPRVPTMYIVSARGDVRRRELGVPLRAAVVDARACRRRSSRCDAHRLAEVERRLRRRRAARSAPAMRDDRAARRQRRRRRRAASASDAPSQRATPPTANATPTRQQVERAGHELGADQHRRQRSTRSSNRSSARPRGSRRARSIRHFGPRLGTRILRHADARRVRDRVSGAVSSYNYLF